MKKRYSVYMLICIIFCGFVARAPITSVGSVIGFIRQDFDLTGAAAGLLSTIPLLVFAVCSPLVRHLTARVGRGQSLILAFCLIVLGGTVRSLLGIIGLYAGTLLIAFGIVVLNITLPAIIKWKFPDSIGAVTGVYVTSMSITGAIAMGFGASAAESFGWQATLLVWPAITIVSLFVSLPVARERKTHLHMPDKSAAIPGKPLTKSSMAWLLSAFMGLQSLLFYCSVTWLPTILTERGLDATQAGYYVLIYQLCNIPGNLCIPIAAGRMREQKLLALGLGVGYVAGFLLLLIGNGPKLLLTAAILLGICAGGCISLAIGNVVLRGSDKEEVERLTGMSESVGYMLAAVGPTLLGMLADMTGSWNIPIVTLLVVALLLSWTGWLSGRNRPLFPESKVEK